MAAGSMPTGTVTFLFTDIERSTRRWDEDEVEMRLELKRHDDAIRSVVAQCGGWLFKHTGDGVCAAFDSAPAAVEAAIEAQRRLRIPVRMGLATGEARPTGDDYFGPVLNRTARITGLGHGGQILVSGSTAGLLSDVDLLDLGEHQLRDVTQREHLFQVLGDGLVEDFPPIQPFDAPLGNLPHATSSLIGRDSDLRELRTLMTQRRLLTLTGVGGVGKTSLATTLARTLQSDFADGVWFVDLVPISDGGSVAPVCATALGIRTRHDRSMAGVIADALVDRHLLIVLDNCEHVLAGAAELVEVILAASTAVSIIVTSREGLGASGEQLWVVPPLDVTVGAGSAAVELFVERARGVVAGFALNSDRERDAVTTICRRLDGIALAIELAAARMVSMAPTEVLSHLDQRFRLLSNSRPTSDRHHTLEQTVQWSYDLLRAEEQTALRASAVFAGGFDGPAVTAVCDDFEYFEMLDLLDSLVRKSLLTATRSGDTTRYRLLETIREFALDRQGGSPDALGARPLDEMRTRHAEYFAQQSLSHWKLWDGPRQREASQWVEVEFDNLRAGYLWAVQEDQLDIAVTIAAHTMALSFSGQHFEPAGWAERLIPAARDADHGYLPRLYLAASFCQFAGRSDDAVRYAEAASALQEDPRFDPFDPGWVGHREALARLVNGRVDQYLDICSALSRRPGLARVTGLFGMTYGLPLVGRWEEAMGFSDASMTAAREHGNPFWIASAHLGCGRAASESRPVEALDLLRAGLDYTREHRLPHFTALIAREAAGLEAVHGDRDDAIWLFTSTMDSFHQAGDVSNVASTLASIAEFFAHVGEVAVAATVLGSTTGNRYANLGVGVAATALHLREVLGDDIYDECMRAGAAMSRHDAVSYVHGHIELTRSA